MEISERYRRIAVRWKSPKGAIAGLILVLTSILVSVLFLEYMSVHGLEDRIEFIQLGTLNLPVRIMLLPSIGVALLFIFAWAYLVEETAYVKASLGPKQEGSLLSLKLAKYAALVTTVFTSSLFLPYILGSAMFLGFLGKMTGLLRFLEPSARSAVSTISSFSTLSENVKYLLSVNLSAFIVLAVTLLLARRRRIPLMRRR
jgi:hypothetical protein